jgi:hypothetical protein
MASGVIYPEDKVELVRAILAKHLLRPPRTASVTTAGYATALYLAQSNLRSVPRPLR